MPAWGQWRIETEMSELKLLDVEQVSFIFGYKCVTQFVPGNAICVVHIHVFR